MAIINFTQNLKRYYPDLGPIVSPETSIVNLIEYANKKYPGIKNYILDEQGNLRKHVQIFIGENLIRDRKGLSDKVPGDEEVYIMQALSGG